MKGKNNRHNNEYKNITNNNSIQILWKKDDQFMDLQDCGMDNFFFL